MWIKFFNLGKHCCSRIIELCPINNKNISKNILTQKDIIGIMSSSKEKIIYKGDLSMNVYEKLLEMCKFIEWKNITEEEYLKLKEKNNEEM